MTLTALFQIAQTLAEQDVRAASIHLPERAFFRLVGQATFPPLGPNENPGEVLVNFRYITIRHEGVTLEIFKEEEPCPDPAPPTP